jgi:hypothetical protein
MAQNVADRGLRPAPVRETLFPIIAKQGEALWTLA